MDATAKVAMDSAGTKPPGWQLPLPALGTVLRPLTPVKAPTQGHPTHTQELAAPSQHAASTGHQQGRPRLKPFSVSFLPSWARFNDPGALIQPKKASRVPTCLAVTAAASSASANGSSSPCRRREKGRGCVLPGQKGREILLTS